MELAPDEARWHLDALSSSLKNTALEKKWNGNNKISILSHLCFSTREKGIRTYIDFQAYFLTYNCIYNQE